VVSELRERSCMSGVGHSLVGFTGNGDFVRFPLAAKLGHQSQELNPTG
jgi:hypothetical protein